MTAHGPSRAELTLQAQLEVARIPFEREYRFHPERKWRFDFALIGDYTVRNSQGKPVQMTGHKIAVEIDGGGFVAGRHSRGAGMEADAEKQSAAAILGWRIIRATPRQVDDGTCLGWIIEAIEKAA